MKKTIGWLFPLFLLFILPAKGGDQVEGAKVLLLHSVNKEEIRSTETNVTGEFFFAELPPGNYILCVRIPHSSFRENIRDKALLDMLIDGGCDPEKGRLVFKLKYNCFVMDIDCEDFSYSSLTPYFTITEEDSGYLVTIANAEIQKKSTLKGIFQSLTPENYKRCLSSGQFKLL